MLNGNLRYLKGAGPQIAQMLSRLGIVTVEDFLYFFPRDYEDRRSFLPIKDLRPGKDVIILAQVVSTQLEKTRRGFNLFKAILSDGHFSVVAVWFNQPFLTKIIKKGQRLIVSGKVLFNAYSNSIELNVKNYDVYDEKSPEKIVPVYPLTEGLYQKRLRRLLKTNFDVILRQVEDYLPNRIISEANLLPLDQALRALHLPDDLAQIETARRRIIFDDFFVFQLGLGMRGELIKSIGEGKKFDFAKEQIPAFLGSLPFALTGAQQKVWDEIKADLTSGVMMQRMLMGDVGSGKTIVAILCAILAAANHCQTAVMVPTEILARQHFAKFTQLLKKMGLETVLLLGGMTTKERRAVLRCIESGDAKIIIGTQALFEDPIKFNDLGLVIIDEQQRFGVMQRARLVAKGKSPHILVMTATPIPRTLALTLYGDLSKSIIDELPPGRTPIQTHFVPEAKRGSAYEFIRKIIQSGEQAFVVCPLVEESEKIDLKAAQAEVVHLQNQVFKDFKVALVHGRMPPDEKEKIMQQFLRNKIQVLVSTTVIEVGIDVPNASIMLIEQAERFGLSQLHQLRGRIGRGSAKSYCLLCGNPKTPEARARIKALLETNDGFKIAEIDLKLRGPGEFFGERQSGLPAFRMADITRDEKELIDARAHAWKILRQDPKLKHPDHQRLRQMVYNRYGDFFGLRILN